MRRAGGAVVSRRPSCLGIVCPTREQAARCLQTEQLFGEEGEPEGLPAEMPSASLGGLPVFQTDTGAKQRLPVVAATGLAGLRQRLRNLSRSRRIFRSSARYAISQPPRFIPTLICRCRGAMQERQGCVPEAAAQHASKLGSSQSRRRPPTSPGIGCFAIEDPPDTYLTASQAGGSRRVAASLRHLAGRT
jgi:hypothetical protein